MRVNLLLVALYYTTLTTANPIHNNNNLNGLLSRRNQINLNRRDIQKGVPDAAPAGYEQWISPIVVPSPVQDGTQNWESAITKAKGFVSQLTIEEKVNLTTGIDTSGRCVGNTGTIPRFNFQGICLQDSPLGIRFVSKVTAFPSAMNAAATFDRTLISRRGVALGQEFRAKGINVALGPMTNLARVAAGGRNWEGWGADPFLSGVATALTVESIQKSGVSACVKHLIGNEQEHYRGGGGATSSSSNMDDRTLHEVYNWPFSEAVRAGVTYAMCSYNRVNQTNACENSKIINGIMKEEADFQGVVLSDWAAMVSGVNSALAGADMNMPGFFKYGGGPDQTNPAIATNSYWGAALVEAVNNGSVPMERLNDMVTRIMSAYYKLGQAALPPVNFTSAVYGPDDLDVQSDHKVIVRDIGAASTILLKNVNKQLPLNPANLQSIAVIGNDATSNPGGPNSCVDRACNNGTLAMGWGSGTAEFPYLIAPIDAIKSHLETVKSVLEVREVLRDYDYVATQDAARGASVALVHVNADSGEGYRTVEGHAGDRNNLSLWHDGDNLIAATAAVCSNTVVIIHAVGAVSMEAWIDHPNVTAVVFAGLPGQESGNSEVDVLFGSVNPSGRLPFTIAKDPADYPAQVLYSSDMPVPQITYSEALAIDYRHFDAANITPRFEFGFGLSYTTFEYGELKVQHSKREAHVRRAEPTGANNAPGLYDVVHSVQVAIKNTGSVAGNEVAQLYVTFPASSEEPPRVLRGFERVSIDAGATETVTFSLRRKDVSIWDVVSQAWVVPAGSIAVAVGASSRDIRATATL